MDLEMILNDLSLRPPATNIQAARHRMSDFISTVIAATSHGVKRSIRTRSNLNSEELAPGYPVARWRNDNEVDRDMRRFLSALITKTPLLDEVSDIDILENIDLYDFTHNNDQAIGLGVTFLLEALAVSLRSEQRWYGSHLKLTVTQIDENGETTDKIEEIPHASLSTHVLEHLDWINERLQRENQIGVNDGFDIWGRKEVLFPNLYFCEKVKEQVQGLLNGDLKLWSIMKKLHELETFCRNWYEGPFDHEKIVGKATSESQTTLVMFAQARTFTCPDGEERIFKWHVRLTPGAWRIYFYPLPDERKLIIGYIGHHLPTVTYHH